jgi:hypothetical protein
MAGAATLSEPRVLAHAKRRLFPETDEPGTYAVSDTQFANGEWLADRTVDAAVRATLAPFNHVRVGSGYPDLVGVCTPDDDLMAVERVGDRPPLLVVEAKGYRESGIVDVERGVVQAHDRLAEANVAFVAAPAAAISPSTRALARELNVGVLGVAVDGRVEPLEVPRVVGTHTADEATAIRFQASAQGVADRSFGLNHPKNYLGVPVALAADGPTGELVAEHVVGAVDDARRGAAFLGLVDERPAGCHLTPLGREVVRFALDRDGSARAALRTFEDWKRSRRRFVDLVPDWGLVARRVVFDYPATTLLVEELQAMHDDGHRTPTLVDLVERLHQLHPAFTVELFVRGTEAARGRVLDGEGALRPDALVDGDLYHAPTVFQLKAMLYHAGIVTERGCEPDRLDPTEDVWALRTPLDRS